MTRTLATATAAACLILASCIPPEEVPPPRSRPYPSDEPQAVEDYGQTADTYTRDGASDPQAGQPTRPGEYPTARPTANPNEVISPYEPYNVIDVEGFSSGQLARDPSNRMIFRVP